MIRSVLHAAEQRGVWTSVAECAQSGPVDMVAAERASQLRVEVHNAGGQVAAGSVAIADLWQVRDPAECHQTHAIILSKT